MQIGEWAGPIAHWAALLNGSEQYYNGRFIGSESITDKTISFCTEASKNCSIPMLITNSLQMIIHKTKLNNMPY